MKKLDIKLNGRNGKDVRLGNCMSEFLKMLDLQDDSFEKEESKKWLDNFKSHYLDCLRVPDRKLTNNFSSIGKYNNDFYEKIISLIELYFNFNQGSEVLPLSLQANLYSSLADKGVEGALVKYVEIMRQLLRDDDFKDSQQGKRYLSLASVFIPKEVMSKEFYLEIKNLLEVQNGA